MDIAWEEITRPELPCSPETMYRLSQTHNESLDEDTVIFVNQSFVYKMVIKYVWTDKYIVKTNWYIGYLA